MKERSSHTNPSPEGEGLRSSTPPLQGRGRGWGLPREKIATLRTRATDMRSNPAEPEKRLWRAVSNSKLGSFKFRRQSVIGSYIADFCCPQKAIVVEIDGDTHRAEADARRDTALAALGFRTVRFTNSEVMANMEGVLEVLLSELRASPDRWPSPHPNPSPEGEGLEKVEARKLLGISIEGSVG